MSPSRLLRGRAGPHALALTDQTSTFDWAQLEDSINRAANALLGQDLGPERRIAVFARNSAETVMGYLAALYSGVSATPVNWHLTTNELAHILSDSAARILFVGPENLQTGIAAANSVGGVMVIGWRCPDTPGLVHWQDWLAAASAEEPPADMRPLPYLQYTSGTTGVPKSVDAVPATRPRTATVAEFFAELRNTPPLRFEGTHLVVGPLYHNGPLNAVRMLAAGIPVFVLPRFEPEDVLKAIDEHRVETSMMVPTHFQRLLELPADVRSCYDLSSLKLVGHTGAACPRQVKAAMIEWFGPVLLEAYGGTECGTTNTITSEEWLAHPGSVGRTLDTFELIIIGKDGARLGPDEIGRIYFRDKSGRGILYRNDPEKTRSVHLEPGVFTLGEVGYYDSAGYLYITDRVSDLVVSGGVNIYPAEVEKALLTHPDVADVAVIGVPNETMGEEVKALVVPRNRGSLPSADDLIAHCRASIAGFKCPRTIDLVEHVGRNAMGKLDKRALRAPFWPTDRSIGG